MSNKDVLLKDVKDAHVQINNLPDVDTPTGHAHSDEEHQQLVALDRRIKLRILFVGGFCLPMIAYICYFHFDLDAPQTLGVLTAFGHFTYFLSLILALIRAHNLYRVVPRYHMLPHWAKMTVPMHVDEYPQYPIYSISEFSSIRGTLSNLFLFAVGLFTLTVYLSLFLQNEPKWNTNTRTRTAAILEFGGGIGLTWIGIFELNPNDRFHKIMHYIGVVICSGSNFGLCVCKQWNAYSVSLLCGLLIFFIIWQVICKINEQKKFTDIEKVTTVSRLAIIMEMILLAFGALAFDSYLFSYNNILNQ